MAGNIGIGRAKPNSSYELPWYVRVESPGLTGAALENAVDSFIMKMGLGRGVGGG